MKRTLLPVSGSDEPEVFLLNPPGSIGEFQKTVLGYYHEHGRDFAWRKTMDPYHILVSEIMLQQTQVERVSFKYPAFLAEFPDFPALAAAPLSGLLSAWQGLGYNRRAIFLQKCAKRVVEEYDGILPQDPEVLATLPGIGVATAASVCAFAFNMPVVFIETNIRRVFIHCFFPEDRTVRDTDILPLVREALYKENPRVWYSALMDLGSDLKKRIPNPNRRSTAYVRQSAFSGSDRQIRGEVIRMLLDTPNRDISELIRETGYENGRVQRIISDLVNEGFLTITGTRVAIRSE